MVELVQPCVRIGVLHDVIGNINRGTGELRVSVYPRSPVILRVDCIIRRNLEFEVRHWVHRKDLGDSGIHEAWVTGGEEGSNSGFIGYCRWREDGAIIGCPASDDTDALRKSSRSDEFRGGSRNEVVVDDWKTRNIMSIMRIRK